MDKVFARTLAQKIAEQAVDTTIGSVPKGMVEQVEKEVKGVVYQDPPWRSWRLWGSFWSIVTGVLVVPEVQTAIAALVGTAVPPAAAPVVTAVLGALWPLISKIKDPREIRQN